MYYKPGNFFCLIVKEEQYVCEPQTLGEGVGVCPPQEIFNFMTSVNAYFDQILVLINLWLKTIFMYIYLVYFSTIWEGGLVFRRKITGLP